MTEVMQVARPGLGLGLTTPSSRQDVISALLNDYGNSFGRDDESSSQYSPVPALKELPPPPPSSDEKPLPAQPLMMRFQLRVDGPDSPTSRNSPSRSRSGSRSPPTRIAYTSMSRKSKPPSLRLTVSNGTTHKVKSPLPSVPAKENPFRDPETVRSPEERPLPPPPPPAKSERRISQRKQPESTDTKASKPERKDSKGPEDDNFSRQETKDSAQQAGQPVKRKPIPGALRTLADLQSGPRGRSAAQKTVPSTVEQTPSSQVDSRRPSIPTTSSLETVRRPSIPTSTTSQERNRRPSIPNPSQETARPPSSSSRTALSSSRPAFTKTTIPTQTPPTPSDQPLPQPSLTRKDSESSLPPPPPPKKSYTGLPSNPRAKGPETPKHVRGKSSTGFDMLKGVGFNKSSQSPVSTTNDKTNTTATAMANLTTITPGPTPSPHETGSENRQGERSLAGTVRDALKGMESPGSSEDDEKRPFSFEPAAAAARQPPAASLPERQDQQKQQAPSNNQSFPTRTTSRPAQVQSAQPQRKPLPTSSAEKQPQPSKPTPQPLGITPRQTTCYTSHSTTTRYTSRYLPTACMTCGQREPGGRYACAWCMLQVCEACWGQLQKIEGRDVAILAARKGIDMKKEGEKGMPSVVIWGAESEDFS